MAQRNANPERFQIGDHRLHSCEVAAELMFPTQATQSMLSDCAPVASYD